jgi:phospholipid/cholesterol/gamma-HCH transport system substrate-binding protein
MDLTYKQEVGVGAFVLVGILVFALGMMWLTGRDITSSDIAVQAVFTDVGNLKGGEPVMVSGVRIGSVANVHLERPGKVVVNLEVQRQWQPHTDARATVRSVGFFGDLYVDYHPGVGDSMLGDRIIVGTREVSLTETASGTAGRASELLANATILFSQQMAQDIHNTMNALQRSLNVLTEAGSGPALRQVTQTLAATEKVMLRVDTLLGAPGVGSTFQRLDTLSANLTRLTNNLSQATTSLRDLLVRSDSGQGTIGRMVTDSTLYDNLNATLEALTKLLNDLRERPGRYVHIRVF